MPDEPAPIALRPRPVPAGAHAVDALYAVVRGGAVVGFVARDARPGLPRAGLWFGHFRSGVPATPAYRSRHNAAAHLPTVLDGFVRPPLAPGTGALPAEALGDA